MLSVSVRTLDYLISQHKLETRRIGRKLLIPRDSLRKFAAADHSEYNRSDAA
jgi:excisionase family DNA binding protein